MDRRVKDGASLGGQTVSAPGRMPSSPLECVIRVILAGHQTLAYLVHHSPSPALRLQLTSWKVCMVTMISLVSAEQSSFSLATKKET